MIRRMGSGKAVYYQKNNACGYSPRAFLFIFEPFDNVLDGFYIFLVETGNIYRPASLNAEQVVGADVEHIGHLCKHLRRRGTLSQLIERDH